MNDIPIEQHRLDNGLRIILSRDPAGPIAAVNIGYDVGSRHEEIGRSGFAHLFEHMMFQGSANIAKGEHGTLINAVGGKWNAATWVDLTNFDDTVPAHEIELALWLEAERLANLLPAVTQQNLDNQREVVQNERRQDYDNVPYGSWNERLHNLLFPPTHPYHHPTIGSMADLRSASLDDVTGFFSAYYAPNNAVLAVAGGFEPDQVLEMIRRHFGPIPANPDIPLPPDMAVVGTGSGEVREVVSDDVELPRVYVANRIPPWGTPDFAAFEVSSDILGTGRAARLEQRLVRGLRLAQDVSAVVFPFAFGAAVFVASATARPGVEIAAVEEALLEEVGMVGDIGPSEAEMDRARVLYRSAHAVALEEAAERADRLMNYGVLFGEPDRVNTDVERYEAVTSTHIQEAWKSSGGSGHRVVLTFLPNRSAIR